MEVPKKHARELVMLRSYKNQLRDAGYKWLNTFYAFGLLKRKRDE